MLKHEIEKMSDRQLDMYLAEHVFNYKWFMRSVSHRGCPVCNHGEDPEKARYERWLSPDVTIDHRAVRWDGREAKIANVMLPPAATQQKNAFEAIEAMRSKFRAYDPINGMTVKIEMSMPGNWHVSIETPQLRDKQAPYFEARLFDLLPRAISRCLVACASAYNEVKVHPPVGAG